MGKPKRLFQIINPEIPAMISHTLSRNFFPVDLNFLLDSDMQINCKKFGC